MADVIELNVQTGEKITRSFTQEEKDNIASAQAEVKKAFDDSAKDDDTLKKNMRKK